jgi:hypothetical protein
LETRQGKLIEALNRVEQFLSANASALDGVVTSTAHQEFSASRQRMAEHLTAQDEHQRGIRMGVMHIRALRRTLVEQHMRPIAILAKAQLPTGERSALRVPSLNRSFAAVVAAGGGMARAARNHEAIFLAAGFPVNFIEALDAATETLKQAITGKGASVGLRVKATGGLKAEAKAARTNLKLLDVRIRASVRDAGLLAQWRNIRRVVAAAAPGRTGIDITGEIGSAGAPPAPSGMTQTAQEAPAAA